MKIRMSKSYEVYEVYDTIEINKEDYPELESLTDQEVLDYLEENLFDFEVNGSDEGSLGNEFEFNKEIVKDKITNEEYTLILINEE
jgi:hypothetical protein